MVCPEAVEETSTRPGDQTYRKGVSLTLKACFEREVGKSPNACLMLFECKGQQGAIFYGNNNIDAVEVGLRYGELPSIVRVACLGIFD